MAKNIGITDEKASRHQTQEMTKEPSQQVENMSREEVGKLVQELRTHQIELEMQNEELRNTQEALENARNRYFRLYHNAPVGYVVLGSNNLINQSNLAFDKMIRREEEDLRGYSFADLLVTEDAHLFRSRFKSFLRNPSNNQMEVRLPTGKKEYIYAHLELSPYEEEIGENHENLDQLLVTITDISEQKLAKRDLEELLVTSNKRADEVAALLRGARSVLRHQEFQTTARKIFDECCDLIGASSGYVAMLSEDGSENELLFLEAGGLPCTVDPHLPMPIRGLREDAYRTNKAVYHNDFMNSKWVHLMPEGHVVLKNVMFAPLVLGGKTVGVIGLANKDGDFDDNDAKLATGFGELAAIALDNSSNLEQRVEADQKRKAVIADLKKALAEVKQLSGLLPICSNCKKIRDDQGYWNQIEAYITEHSEAHFTHSICQDCADKLYPDLDL
jgi:PAS domain S-box-containing protein